MKKNYGIYLLKAYMSFEVICAHFSFGDKNYYRICALFAGYTVPVFVILSSILSADKIICAEKKWFKKRIGRLLIPHVSWTIIIWICFRVLFLLGDETCYFSGWDLIWQMLLGHVYNTPMWYLVDLLWITALMYLVFSIVEKKNGFILLGLLALVCILLQYSGLNYAMFNLVRSEIKYPVGRLCEVYPNAFIGLFAAWIIRKEKTTKDNKKVILIGSVILFLCGYIIEYFTNSPPGFGNGGVNIILVSLGIVGFAYAIPLERLPISVRIFIEWATDCTPGIYYIHLFVGIIISKFVEHGLLCCILIYFASFFICKIIKLCNVKWLNLLVE